jgi:hypothetical protein
MINPFTGVLMKVPPRPARVRVRARALKRLKDLVN